MLNVGEKRTQFDPRTVLDQEMVDGKEAEKAVVGRGADQRCQPFRCMCDKAEDLNH
jgi:hypothetical protein